MPQPAHRIEFAVLSDLGMRRLNNQDSAAASTDGNGGSMPGDLFIVADGMGAHAAGELASKLAVDNVPHLYRKSKERSPHAALRHAIHRTNAVIHAKGESSPDFHGMGTTCTCLVVLDRLALVAHVGDSRVYRLRRDRLEQLTFDHSLVWEMAAAQNVSADKVPSCIPKNVITRSLGPHAMVQVDLEGPHELEPGDVFLLCSDGLTAVIDDELMGALLGAMPPEEAARTLVDVANLRGGPDNISVVIARVADADPGAKTPPEATPQKPTPGGRRAAAAGLMLAGAIGVVWFASLSQSFPMLISAAAAGAGLMLALMGRGAAHPAHPSDTGGPYGNGPYRSIDCQTGEGAAHALAEVVAELSALRDREEKGPDIDWAPFDAAREQAKAKRDAGDVRGSLTSDANAIRGLMEQVRKLAGADSGIFDA
ncbi:Putative protein phosphatase 2C-type [Pirellulimonas nuda]|uniref:PPM-type phosphatase domain-containing protein n=1 Tax=Pirellulimonas nuda TaxID=2528009 RepID=A0A518D8L3_9BACT|nr:PP2C family serine/threonine-protein phosphatase [Pirellulimonas nuda]QDU87821.1 Putative protein phosphatase 2C-type [Pirellulimonas nuda]